MFHTIVPTRALVGTFALFMLFLIIFMVLLSTKNMMLSLNWLLIPLILGVGIALINCIRNMQEIINATNENIEHKNMNVYLDSCPEYWIKDTIRVIDPTSDSDNSNSDNVVNICKNYYMDKKTGNYHFVGGSGTAFATNFSDETTSPPPTLSETLTTMNNKFIDKERPKSVETFYAGIGDEETPLMQNVLNPDKSTDERQVQFVTTDPNVLSMENEQLSSIQGNHIHHTGGITYHNNADDINGDGVHDAVKGLGWHVHDINNAGANRRETMRGTEFTDGWIHEVPSSMSHRGIDINLDKLNEAANVCELSGHFYWTEADNKCKRRPVNSLNTSIPSNNNCNRQTLNA
jgi:hypothetical protein